MNNTIFVPKKINVGFQNRSDTYTKKLAYVIYFDEKGKLRKETSWNSWRDHKIDPQEYENSPTSGFVLNKKVGDYTSDWNHHRQAYVRIYDPRDFEFEITVQNLLYILENTSAIKGKGLDGDFVYGWDGKDLLLIPTSSPDYIKISQYSRMISKPESIKQADMVLGGTYRTKQNEDWIYLGKFDKYISSPYHKDYGKKLSGKYYYFYHNSFVSIKSLSGKIVKTISTEPISNYAKLMEQLETRTEFSPVDPSKDEYVPLTKEEIESWTRNKYYGIKTYININGKMLSCDISRYYMNSEKYSVSFRWKTQEEKQLLYHTQMNRTFDTIDELYNMLSPFKKNEYLMNGKPSYLNII